MDTRWYFLFLSIQNFVSKNMQYSLNDTMIRHYYASVNVYLEIHMLQNNQESKRDDIEEIVLNLRESNTMIR